MEMNQVLLYLSLLLLLSPFYSTTSLAQPPAAAPKAPKAAAPKAPAKPAPVAPAAAPKAPAKPAPVAPAAAPPKPLVPTLPGDAPESSSDDIIKILRKAKSFSVLIRLFKTTQVINQINSQLITTKNGGLTILAPDDSAFSQLKPGFLNSLSNEQQIQLVQYHVLPVYVASSNFDALSNPVRTVASDSPTGLKLNVTAYGNSVNISTGVVDATLTGVVYSDKQLAIYHVDKVLLPLDFFQKPKATAPAPALSPEKAPKSAKENSSAASDQEDDQDGRTQNKSGAVSSISFQRTTLMSLGVAFVLAAATI